MVRALIVSTALLLTTAPLQSNAKPMAMHWQPAHTTAPSQAGMNSKSTFLIGATVQLGSSCYHTRIFKMTPVDPKSAAVYEVQQARPGGICPQSPSKKNILKCTVISRPYGPPVPNTVWVSSASGREEVKVSRHFIPSQSPCPHTDK